MSRGLIRDEIVGHFLFIYLFIYFLFIHLVIVDANIIPNINLQLKINTQIKIAIYKKKANQGQLSYIKNMTYNVKKEKKRKKKYICLKRYINPT